MLPKCFKKGICRAWETVGNTFVAEAWGLEFKFIVKTSVKTGMATMPVNPLPGIVADGS